MVAINLARLKEALWNLSVMSMNTAFNNTHDDGDGDIIRYCYILFHTDISLYFKRYSHSAWKQLESETRLHQSCIFKILLLAAVVSSDNEFSSDAD